MAMKLLLWVVLIGLYSVSQANKCTAAGKFPDDDAECRGFTLCLFGGAGGYMQYNVTCPVGFVYTHLEQQCTNSTTYQCHPSFVCNMTGNFENPNKNCSSYVACVGGINTIVTARMVECHLNHTFDPLDGVCTNRTDYQCSTGVSDSVTNVTHNITEVNVQVTGDKGFHSLSNDSMNSAVHLCSKSALVFIVMMFVLN